MKVAIIGANGVGCTSLAKALMNKHNKDIEIVDASEVIKEKLVDIVKLSCCPTHIDALKVKQMCAERSPLSRKTNKSDRKRNRANRW